MTRGAEYEPLPDVHPHVQAGNQVLAAIEDIERPAEAYLRWPWSALDAVTGPIGAPGVLWFVCAFSSIGKTTFVTSLIELWRAQGRRIYVMPLETEPKEFRKHLSCVQLGIYPGDVLSGHGASLPNWKDVRKRLNDTLMTQFHPPFVDQVMISEQKAINVSGLKEGLKEAKVFGADIVIVDHIDHIGGNGGASSNLYAESRAVNHQALHMAQENELRLLFTSQLNLEIAKSPDHLAKYGPPRDTHVLMGNVKRQVATGMVGLFRRPRERLEHETDNEYVDLLKGARAGQIEAPKVLDSAVMGVNAMKLRHYGAREGTRVYLGFEQGRVTDLDEKDRWTTSGYPRPVVA